MAKNPPKGDENEDEATAFGNTLDWSINMDESCSIIGLNGNIIYSPSHSMPNKSISLLLGAGFSAPMGYPIGNRLSEKILGCQSDDFKVSLAGELLRYNEEGVQTSDEPYLDLLIGIIKHYNDDICKDGKDFNYEEFYDYIQKEAKGDSWLKEAAKKIDDSVYKKCNGDLTNVVYQLSKRYNQLIQYYLKDGKGEMWYEDVDCPKATYKGFINCIKELSKDHIINVHTLNHDLLFEHLNKFIETPSENGSINVGCDLSDGFEELGSPYYGKLKLKNRRSYMCRLPRYTGKYDTRIRLYKLHGSMDQYRYNGSEDSSRTLDNYIKIRQGISEMDLYKEIVDENGNPSYDCDHTQYHPDFLTGTTAKIERYSESFYNDLLALFEKNLEKAEMLIIIGYGCKDSKINSYIRDYFDKTKPCFVIDLCRGESVNEFVKKRGSKTKLIEKDISHISIRDLK